MIDLLGAVIRWATFAAILVAVGAVAFRFVVLRSLVPTEPAMATSAARAASIALAGVRAIPLLALVRLGLQTSQMRFSGDPWLPVGWRMVADTGWGHAWTIQVTAAVVLVIAFAAARNDARWGWTLALVTAPILAVTPTLASHALTGERVPLGIVADVLHVMAAGLWVGTLAAMFGALVWPLRSGAIGRHALAAWLARFSPMALTSGAVLGVSGVVSALRHIHDLAALTGTNYGRVLLVKLAIVALVGAIGFRNWRVVTPAIATEGTRPMTRGMALELIVAAIVLLATAVLVTTPPPSEP